MFYLAVKVTDLRPTDTRSHGRKVDLGADMLGHGRHERLAESVQNQAAAQGRLSTRRTACAATLNNDTRLSSCLLPSNSLPLPFPADGLC